MAFNYNVECRRIKSTFSFLNFNFILTLNTTVGTEINLNDETWTSGISEKDIILRTIRINHCVISW